ncbi:MAG: RNA methyltransferase [Azoarcus sp.]|nr:RNA methyltransferase [Azoarcus sp.]
MKSISSKDNPALKALRALVHDPREQRAQGRTVLDGPHLIEAYWHHGGVPEYFVLSETGSQNKEAIDLVSRYTGMEVMQVPDRLFRELSPVVTPVGILAVIAIPALAAEQPLAGNCVLLDAVQDAGNIGAILRTAAAAGVAEVALGAGCASAWSPKTLRAAQGAHFSLRIREQANLAALLGDYDGACIATVAREGISLFDCTLPAKVAWLFGNEGAGISAALLPLADMRVTIPLAAETESLNVAAAAAVCLFEQVRQRLCC